MSKLKDARMSTLRDKIEEETTAEDDTPTKEKRVDESKEVKIKKRK